MIIISGYQGVGKSTFTNTSHKERFGREIICIDFESSNFDKTNPDWYKEYVNKIVEIHSTSTADVLFISSHQSVRDLLNSLKIEFLFLLPSIKAKHDWTHMLAERVQGSLKNNDYDKNVRALMSHILKYDAIIEELSITHKPMTESKRPCETVGFVPSPSDSKYFVYQWIDRQIRRNLKK